VRYNHVLEPPHFRIVNSRPKSSQFHVWALSKHLDIGLRTGGGAGRLSEHERSRTELMRILRFHSIFDDVCCTLIHVRESDELFAEICRTTLRNGLFRQAWIGLVDPTTMAVRRVASTEGNASNFDQFCVLSVESTDDADHEARSIGAGECFVINDIETDPRHIPWRLQALEQGLRSSACVPLRLGDRLFGVFKLYSNEIGLFGDLEIQILKRLAVAISHALATTKSEEHRRRAEKELHESEGRYRRVVENMIGLVSQTDGQKTFQYVSSTYKPVMGYEPEQLLGKSFLEFVHDDDTNSTRSAFRSAERTHSTTKVELRFRQAGGHYSWLEMVVDPMFDEFDRLSGFISASRSIGERKEAEEKLRKHTENLERVIQDRTETIRKLNETTTQRLIQKINQINHISEIRDSLKRSEGLQHSYETILDAARTDLNMSVGTILTINKEKHLAEIQVFKPMDKAVESNKNYSLDTPYIEYECLASHNAISKIVRKELSILGTLSSHCSPIVFMNDQIGLLALGRASEETLDVSDLSVLRLYSGLVTSALETTSLSVEPARETCETRKGRFNLEYGSNYLVADSIDLAYDMFTDTIMTGTEGLCITRKLPQKLRERYGLQKTPMVCLTGENIRNERTINSLQDLSILISNYVDKAEKPLILIDGIEYLMSHQGFDPVYHFLQAKGTQVEAAEGIMIIPFFKETLEPRQVKLLEREFGLFEEKEKDA
jgi:PAS domain S-box-containing protein